MTYDFGCPYQLIVMAGKTQKTLEDLNLTKDELDRFSKAFKEEEFRKLFREYAEEINDPENRRK